VVRLKKRKGNKTRKGENGDVFVMEDKEPAPKAHGHAVITKPKARRDSKRKDRSCYRTPPVLNKKENLAEEKRSQEEDTSSIY